MPAPTGVNSMTATNDAIAAFLAKGGKIVKVSSDKRALTEGQIYAAMRDPTPAVKVVEVLPYPGKDICATIERLFAGAQWDNDNAHRVNHRHIANCLMSLKLKLEDDKDTWLETNNSQWQNHAAHAMRQASKVLWAADSMHNDTYRAINSLYRELTNSKMDLI